ncbi:class II aldolase/adducin family protein [Streptomyces violens]|uniref:class II aldolase/adducin family protein n=1 Tax=Streptomyces violens TaxID=66377 RepID=UPI00068C68B6|nr:class II aldolase/adducin family protein [Streptomyces violens]
MKPVYIDEDAERQRALLSAACRALHERGWMPGTSGNVSVRSGEAVVITAGDQRRGTITHHNTVMVDPLEGLPLLGETEWPPAETPVHLAIYRQLPDCGAVVQAHAPYSTALATLIGSAGSVGQAVFQELELAKGLGVPDPSLVGVPVFENWPDASRIAADVTAYLDESAAAAPPVLLIGRHGATTWGRDIDEARNRLECIEELSHLTLLTGAFGPGTAKECVR